MFKTAAVLYFKVLCIYPSPLDLIGMYDSNLPKPVMEVRHDCWTRIMHLILILHEDGHGTL
jgi:hypothetical protein